MSITVHFLDVWNGAAGPGLLHFSCCTQIPQSHRACWDGEGGAWAPGSSHWKLEQVSLTLAALTVLKPWPVTLSGNWDVESRSQFAVP